MLLNHTCGIDGDFFPDGGPDAERIQDVIPQIAVQRRRGTDLQATGDAAFRGATSGRVTAPYVDWAFSQQGWHQHPHFVCIRESEPRASWRHSDVLGERPRDFRGRPRERWRRRQPIRSCWRMARG
jgi:hypothetical protein